MFRHLVEFNVFDLYVHVDLPEFSVDGDNKSLTAANPLVQDLQFLNGYLLGLLGLLEQLGCVPDLVLKLLLGLLKPFFVPLPECRS